MIQLYDNWYQLNDNNLWGCPLHIKYDARAFRLLCLGDTKARILGDNNTVVLCNCANGYKLRLSAHTPQEQNNIIDVLTPYL